MAEGVTYPYVSRVINIDTHMTSLTVPINSYDMR
ncbi:hypothetical protein PC116_g23303 [Phytophthora cactorum]|nr:hypothetical protein PC116_g23303 [Phytophthora cactorum]